MKATIGVVLTLWVQKTVTVSELSDALNAAKNAKVADYIKFLPGVGYNDGKIAVQGVSDETALDTL